MEYHEIELEAARSQLKAAGYDRDDFTFRLGFLPPDPDGGGMISVEYQITVANTKSGRVMQGIGGIGMGWGEYFANALKEGFSTDRGRQSGRWIIPSPSRFSADGRRES